MTPLEIEEYARQQYNAVGDSFFTQTEVMRSIYRACLEMAREALLIEKVFTASTVASQQEYDFPENAISIKRIAYNGNKLHPISFQEDDALTLNNSTTTASGTPQYYAEWNETFFLRPIPAEVGTLKVFAYVEPQTVSSTSSLEIPSMFHMGLVDPVLRDMYAKDKDFISAKYFDDRWEKTKLEAKKWARKRKRGDSFAGVKDEESLPTTILGAV